MIAPYFTSIVCLECGHTQPPENVMAVNCPACGSAWLDARYDYGAVAELWRDGLPRRYHTLWRYGELLPIQPTIPEISMGEGYTSLQRLYPYEKLYNHPYIWVKDERGNPTNSFKDRQAAMSVMAMAQAGITECVLASTGNAAVAYAAYCARAGIKLWLFLTSLVPADKMREAALYGCEVVKVSGTYDETKHVAAEFAQRKGIHFDRGAKAVPGKESMKTLAYEIAEQLGLRQTTPQAWAAPDWYIQAVSGGIGPLGVLKGFEELHGMGLIDRVPKLAVIQAEGCSPMVRAFHAGAAKADPVQPQTLITVLATGDPGHAYSLLREAILSYGGTMTAIEDGETFAAMRRIASRGGMSVEPATAVAFAGLERLLQEGVIAPDESVVVNCSGHTFTAESHVLGDQYEQYILDLHLSQSAGKAPVAHLHEGLGAALKTLDEQVTTIVVVDDNPHDRRLIRRLLHSYKKYRIYEARDAEDALLVVRDRQPDLVVTDLTLPGMDGFALLERLKQDEATAHIPVIVASAKTLTTNDRNRLEQASASFWQKGGVDTRGLVDQVVTTLGHETLDVVQAPPVERPAPVNADATDTPTVEGTPTHTIVVIDDNPFDLRLARRIITSGGNYSVIEAETGRDGLKAIYNYHPDLIVLDLTLPDMDGFTVLDTLHKDVNLREIPVIIYSARDVTAEERALLQDRIRQLVSKTELDRKQFLATIQGELN